MKEIKWDFSNMQPTDCSCPYCYGQVVHPETYRLLCDKHRMEFESWHNKEVAVGNIGSWFNF